MTDTAAGTAGKAGTDASRTELGAEQLGHLRHFANLLAQPPNDWSFMQGKGFGQDDFGSYRFQLAYMCYAMALTHVHRLPAAPGVFKPLVQRSIEKMLLPEVWLYWKDTSRGGAPFNAHLSDRYREQYDPVVRDNIMYSAYVQSMALLFNYLFDDDRYAQPGALSFRFYSPFWGGDEKRFDYDQNSLNEHIYWQMVQNGYLGVACEPNCVFQICNQPAILGFRLHDILTGGSVAREVTQGYERAWAEFGRLDADGRYQMFMLEDSQTLVANASGAPWVDAWCGALMNMWNREFVREHYPRQLARFLERGQDGALSVRPGGPLGSPDNPVAADSCDHGWTAVWASEMGDADTLNGLLMHADRYLNPTWRRGGLYYPRNDEPLDAEGRRTEMEPMTGNVLLGYARLNVPDGLWALYNHPWGAEHHAEPALTSVDPDVDVSLAYFDPARRELRFTLARRAGQAGDGRVVIGNLGRAGARFTVCEGAVELAAGGRDMPLTSDHPGLRASADGLELTCRENGVHRFTVRFTGEPARGGG